MRLLDLFSGIGGFSLAARWAGIETVAFCERDVWCQKVLRKNFGKDIVIHDDTKTLDGTQYRGAVDIISGGFPCQPFSLAGKQRGADDDRYLWPAMLRIIEECRPRWVLGENVAGIINLALDTVLSDLESIGYAAWPIVIPAAGVNAPHRRERVWIFAYAESHRPYGHNNESEIQRLVCEWAESERLGQYVADSKSEQFHGCGDSRRGGPRFADGCEAVADADGTRSQGRLERGECTSEWLAWSGDKPDSRIWESDAGIRRVAHGIPRRVDRLRGLGNAIVPQVAYVLFRYILEIDAKLTSAQNSDTLDST